jgi:hypothetical protein
VIFLCFRGTLWLWLCTIHCLASAQKGTSLTVETSSNIFRIQFRIYPGSIPYQRPPATPIVTSQPILAPAGIPTKSTNQKMSKLNSPSLAMVEVRIPFYWTQWAAVGQRGHVTDPTCHIASLIWLMKISWAYRHQVRTTWEYLNP